MSIRAARFNRLTMTATERKQARQWGMADDGRTVATVTASAPLTLPRVTEARVLNVFMAVACTAVMLAGFTGMAGLAVKAAPTAPAYEIVAINYMGEEFIAGSGDTCAEAERGMVLPVGVVEYGCHPSSDR